jgi:aquaporin Z
VTSTEPLNWREYAIEAALLAAFMCSAAAFATLLQHPSSPVFVGAGEAAVERIPMGIAMGLTAIALIYSPWGARSGAHLNPAVTLTFWRLNKIASRDAVLYVVAQCIGGLAGIVVATVALARLPADPAVNYVATVPGTSGAVVALIAEFVISCGLMLVVLLCSNHPRLAPFTGAAAGALVCAYIVVEAPLSGMSMNPARSLGPAVLAGTIDSMWIYVIGPLAGMLSAAVVHERYAGSSAIACAKLHHPSHIPCIHCGAGARTSRAVHRPEEVPV